MFLVIFQSETIFPSLSLKYIYYHPLLKKKRKDKREIKTYLHCKGPQNDGAENGIGEYSSKDISLSMDLASVNLIEKLHEDEGVKNDGVVLRGRRVQWSIATTVNVKHMFSWKVKNGEGIQYDAGQRKGTW